MFEKILIANRGEVAARLARTCGRLGAETWVLCREGDQEAPHVLEGDHILPLESDMPSPEWVIHTAHSLTCNAVYVGYGLFSEVELSELQQRLQALNIAWIGPQMDVVARVKQQEILQSTLEGLSIKHIESEIQQSPSQDAVTHATFRWIEVDVLGQVHPVAETVVLADREVIFGKNKQRVLAESPAVVTEHFRKGAAIRGAIWEAAQQMVEALALTGYVQVLFAVDAEGCFYFHSLHLGLIPEHVTTEMSTGLDLVEEEMRLSKGEGMTLAAKHAQPTGHVIQCAVEVAIDPKTKKAYQGKVEDARFAPLVSGKNRLEIGVGRGSVITANDQPVLLNMAAFGATRHESILTLDRMIAEMKLSPVLSNVRLLRKAINTETFRVGTYDGQFWDKVGTLEGM